MIKIENEKNTIAAINDINEKYPYAASLLAYTLIERILKIYIISNRKNKKKLSHTKEITNKCGKVISLRDFKQVDDEEEFIEKFIKSISLGNAEELINGISFKRFSEQRNRLVHSDFYLSNDMDLEYNNRVERNRDYFETALNDLNEAINKYSDIKVKIVNNNIKKLEIIE